MSRTEPDEDELLNPARVPEWAWWTAGVAAVVLVVALVLVRANSQSPRLPSALSSAPSSTAESIATIPTGTSAAAVSVHLPSTGSGPLDGVVTDGRTTWVLHGDVLLRRTGSSAWQAHRIVDTGLTASQLLFDRITRRLWVLATTTDRSFVQAYDPDTLQPLGFALRPHAVYAAAPLGGSLYVADGTGLFRITAVGHVTAVDFPSSRDVVGLTADPTRNRMLVEIATAKGARLTLLGGAGSAVSAALPAHLAKETLAVTRAGDIWLAGFSRTGAILIRLDPTTLRRAGLSPVVLQVGPGAVLLAAGADDLLVAPGDGSGELYCMAGNGAQLEKWLVPAESAALAPGSGYVTVGDSLLRLHLAGPCTG